jgi:hypothetical protein
MNRFKEVTKIEVEGTYCERTGKCEYLGTILNENGNMALDVKARIAKGNKCCCALNSLIKTKIVSINAKLNIYRTTV